MTEFVRNALSKAAPVMLAALCIAFLIGGVVFLRASLGMDFGVYWRVANQPVELAYELRETLNFPYPPTMLLWVAPLSLIPKWAAYGAWVAISAGALALACRRYLTPIEIVLLIASPPVAYCLLTGQVTAALAALLLWAIASPNPCVRGLLLAVIASVKPQLVLMAPLFLIFRREWQTLLISGVGLFAVFALSILAFGLQAWQSWVGALDHFHFIVIRNGVLSVTITPAAVAELRHLPPLPFLIGGAVVGACLVFACRNKAPLIQMSALATGSLLAAPYAIIYDLSMVAPFLVWNAMRGRIASVVALSAGLNPLPLLIAGYELAARRAPDGPGVTDGRYGSRMSAAS